MRFYNERVINNGDASLNTKSIIIESKACFLASAQIVVVGTATGTVFFEVSNDDKMLFVPIGTPLSISGTGMYLIPATSICYDTIRVSFLNTSGTGTIDAAVHMVGY